MWPNYVKLSAEGVLSMCFISLDPIFLREPMVHMKHTNDDPPYMLIKHQQSETGWKISTYKCSRNDSTRTEQLYVLSHDRSWGRGWVSVNRFKPTSYFLLTVPRRHVCCGSDLFVIIFIVLLIAWFCGHSKTVGIALCIVFCCVQASTVTTSLQ